MSETQIQLTKQQFETFQELNNRFQACKQAVIALDSTAVSVVRDKRMTELTLKALDTMPADVPTYFQLGRAYIMQDEASLKEDLKKHVQASERELQVIEDRKRTLSEQGAALTNDLQELFKDAVNE